MNIILVSGEDSFSIHELLKKWQTAFIQKHGDFNFEELEGKNLKAEKIIEYSEQVPFLAEKRLIFVHEFLKNGDSEEQKKIANNFKKIPLNSVLVFCEKNDPDKRTTLYKRLIKDGRHENFVLKSGSNLTAWVQKKFAENGKQVAGNICEYLWENVGNDLWQLKNEIEKLSLYCEDRDLEKTDIDLLTHGNIHTTIFKFVETIGKKDKKASLLILQGLADSGEELMFIFHMLVRQTRMLTLTCDLLKKGENQFSLGKKLKIPPFAIKNTIEQAKNFDLEKLANLYAQLCKIEIGIKTGRIRISKDNQKDFLLAMEKFILSA